MLISENVPISQSALLVIDVQDSFKATSRWERRDNLAFEAKMSSLIEAHRAACLPIIYFLHTDGDEGFARTSPHFRLMDFIKPRSNEPILEKDTRNGFTGTALPALLLEKGVRRVAISGISMEQCCETNARVASDLGYAVDFVIDATMTFPIPNPNVPGEELGVEAIRERTEYALRNRFARIISTAQLIEELESAK